MVADSRRAVISRCNFKTQLQQKMSKIEWLSKNMGFIWQHYDDFRPKKKIKIFPLDIAKQPSGARRPPKKQVNKDLVTRKKKIKKLTDIFRWKLSEPRSAKGAFSFFNFASVFVQILVLFDIFPSLDKCEKSDNSQFFLQFYDLQ